MSIAPVKGSEAEFLQQLSVWQPCACVCTTMPAASPKKKAKAGPSSRAASTATASSLPASSSARYFLYLEQSDASSSSAAAASSSSSSSSTAPRSLRLTVSNILRVWHATLDFPSFRRHRESLGIAAVGWKDMMSMLQQCFKESRVSILPTSQQNHTDLGLDQEEVEELVISCRYTIGSEVELEGRFTLRRIEDDSSSFAAAYSSSPPSMPQLTASQTALSHLLFGVFSRTATATDESTAPLQSQLAILRGDLSAARAESASLRAENAKLLSERATWLSGSAGASSSNSSSQHHASSHDGTDSTRSPVAASAAAGAKRKPPKQKNMSVLNPHSKRRKLGGIKIE